MTRSQLTRLCLCLVLCNPREQIQIYQCQVQQSLLGQTLHSHLVFCHLMDQTARHPIPYVHYLIRSEPLDLWHWGSGRHCDVLQCAQWLHGIHLVVLGIGAALCLATTHAK